LTLPKGWPKPADRAKTTSSESRQTQIGKTTMKWYKKAKSWIIIGIIIVIILMTVGILYWLYTFPKAPHLIVCPPKNIVLNNTNSLSNNTSVFLLDCLSSGDRSIYERKAVIAAEFPKGERKEYLAWGDEVIPIFGSIASIPPNSTDLSNKIIMIKAMQNSQLIFEKFAKTDHYGTFNSSFFPPNDGTIQVTAKLIDVNSTSTEAAITVIATEAWMPIILILIFTVISIALVVGFWLWYNQNKTKNAYILRIGAIPTVIPIMLTYFILYKFPPFDATANAAIATVLIGPLAAYIYEVITK